MAPDAVSKNRRHRAAITTFNSLCPIHKRKCKCSLRGNVNWSNPFRPQTTPSHAAANATQLVSTFVCAFTGRSESYCLWLTEAVDHMFESTALQQSILALALGVFASDTGDLRIHHQSELVYTRALLCLRREISDPELVKSDATLAASFVVGRYHNVSSVSQADHVAAHFRGNMDLIRFRGPDSFVASSFSRVLFVYVQSALSAFSLLCVMPSMFAESEWQDLASRLLPFDDLNCWSVRLHACTASLAALRARLQHERSRGELLKLQEDTLAATRDLESLAVGLPFAQPTITLTTLILPGYRAKPPIACSFVFQDSHTAVLTSTAWVNLCAAYLLLHQIQERLQDNFPIATTLHASGKSSYGSVARDYAVRLCMCAQYILETNKTALGRTCLMFPLPVAIQALSTQVDSYAPLISWAQVALEESVCGRVAAKTENVSQMPVLSPRNMRDFSNQWTLLGLDDRQSWILPREE